MSITGALSRRRAIQIVASAAGLALMTGLRGALAAARAFGEATGGAFDPTVQPLWTLYATHFAASAARPEGPDGSAIDKAIALVDYRNLSLTTSRVAFERRGMSGYSPETYDPLKYLHIEILLLAASPSVMWHSQAAPSRNQKE